MKMKEGEEEEEVQLKKQEKEKEKGFVICYREPIREWHGQVTSGKE